MSVIVLNWTDPENFSSLVKEFAGEGLRTLALAYKDLDEDIFDEWTKKLLFASTTLENREERLGDLYEEIEQGLMVRADLWTAYECDYIFISLWPVFLMMYINV